MKRVGTYGIVLLSAALSSVWACTGDDDVDLGPDDGAVDASTVTDSGRTADASKDAATNPVDARADAPVDGAISDASDAEVDTVTRRTGPSGLVYVDDVYVVAQFYASDTIVRDSTAPECFALLRPADGFSVNAGTITLGGEIVGKEGGLSEEGTFDYDTDSGEYFFEGDGNGIFPMGEGYTLSFTLSGTTGFPAVTIAALPTPKNENATFTAPALGAERTLSLRTDTDFVFTWTPPASSDGQTITLAFTDFTNPVDGVTGALYCNFPAGVGSGRVSAGLLAALRDATAGESGLLRADLGGATVLGSADGAAYLVQARRLESTDWAALFTEPSQIALSFE